MIKHFLLATVIILSLAHGQAQSKKPLDHSVYDGWKSLGERMISNDGKYIVYTINPQEGDGELVIKNVADNYTKTITRGGSAVISTDSRYVFFKIKAPFKDTRQAKIKKKKPDEMPKDSLGIIELGKDSVIKIARIKSFKSPEKAAGYMAYQYEKPLPDSAKKKPVPDSVKTKM
ncbi:MAG: S9 family peptidase, partial [Aquabacterium sp.]|nr:S9 family peptidase [Ferruginibacter sp.]